MATTIATAIFLITIPLVLELFKTKITRLPRFPSTIQLMASLFTLGSAPTIQLFCLRLLLRIMLFL